MVQDLLTAIALLLIIEGLLPGISPTAWQKIAVAVSALICGSYLGIDS
jgi:uncharacterized protein YjeT (DUF2065 family)